jgi:hypothetical protein
MPAKGEIAAGAEAAKVIFKPARHAHGTDNETRSIRAGKGVPTPTGQLFRAIGVQTSDQPIIASKERESILQNI